MTRHDHVFISYCRSTFYTSSFQGHFFVYYVSRCNIYQLSCHKNINLSGIKQFSVISKIWLDLNLCSYPIIYVISFAKDIFWIVVILFHAINSNPRNRILPLTQYERWSNHYNNYVRNLWYSYKCTYFARVHFLWYTGLICSYGNHQFTGFIKEVL